MSLADSDAGAEWHHNKQRAHLRFALTLVILRITGATPFEISRAIFSPSTRWAWGGGGFGCLSNHSSTAFNSKQWARLWLQVARGGFLFFDCVQSFKKRDRGRVHLFFFTTFREKEKGNWVHCYCLEAFFPSYKICKHWKLINVFKNE